METFQWIMYIVWGFASGSVMFCSLVPKLICRKDICEIADDGNPGAFNVFKHCGKVLGCICLFLDALKGFAPVLCASLLMNTNSFWFAFVLASPVLGHAVGLFNGLKGGKCIATSFGAMFGLIPVSVWGIVCLALLYILFSTLFKITPNRRRSIVVYALFLFASLILFNVIGLYSVGLGCAFICLIAIVKHVDFSALGERRRN